MLHYPIDLLSEAVDYFKRLRGNLKTFCDRVISEAQEIRDTVTSLRKATDKHQNCVNDPYNFLDVNNNIRMHEELIREEDKRLLGKRRQTAIILTIFGLLFVYFPQIIAFMFSGNAEWWFYLSSVPYFIGATVAIICFVLYIWPVDIPQHISPTYFFETDLKQYVDEGYDEEQAGIGVKYSYLRHLEKFLSMLQKANRRKGGWHYWCIFCLSITFFFYFSTSTIVLVSNAKNKETISNNNNMFDKKKFDPSKAHDVPPQVIKEGHEIKFVNTTSKGDSTGSKKK